MKKIIVLTGLSFLIISIVLHSCKKIDVPVVTTSPSSEVTQTTAISGGVIDKGSSITAKGVCWSTNDPPSIKDDTTNVGPGPDSFTSLITDLKLNTTYYLRAYATNSAGTGYGMAISFKTKANYNIGDSYLGGKIAYILQIGDPGYVDGETHGLIAAPEDQSSGINWRSDGIPGAYIGAGGFLIGTGNSNTIAIVNHQSTGDCAAKICSDLVLNGYDDWYLPSSNELEKLCNNMLIIGGFEKVNYWSSTEYNTSVSDGAEAYFRSFNSCSQGIAFVWDGYRVRAIRSF